jgi:pyridinium-3,5-biscarboxylic acid mononucleotide sulfurtransferase
VEQAELIVRQCLHLGVSANLRVRAMAGEKALIEVDAAHIGAAQAQLSALQAAILPLGFSEVGLRQFRSGSLSGHTAQEAVQITRTLYA